MSANREPLTWACECGLMNLWPEKTCRDCGGDRAECWTEADKKRAVYEWDTRNPEQPRERLVGFD